MNRKKHPLKKFHFDLLVLVLGSLTLIHFSGRAADPAAPALAPGVKTEEVAAKEEAQKLKEMKESVREVEKLLKGLDDFESDKTSSKIRADFEKLEDEVKEAIDVAEGKYEKLKEESKKDPEVVKFLDLKRRQKNISEKKKKEIDKNIKSQVAKKNRKIREAEETICELREEKDALEKKVKKSTESVDKTAKEILAAMTSLQSLLVANRINQAPAVSTAAGNNGSVLSTQDMLLTLMLRNVYQPQQQQQQASHLADPFALFNQFANSNMSNTSNMYASSLVGQRNLDPLQNLGYQYVIDPRQQSYVLMDPFAVRANRAAINSGLTPGIGASRPSML